MKRDLRPFQIAMAVTSASIGGIVALLAEIRDVLGFSISGIGLIVAAGFFASFVAQTTLASYADRGHARTMVAAGVLLSSASMGLLVVADSFTLWLVCRAVLGFAGGLILPGLRRAATVLDPERVGESLGRLIVGEVVGFLIGPLLAALLAEVGGLRLPFAVFAVGMAAFLPAALRLPPDNGEIDDTRRRLSFDLLRLPRLQSALILVGGYFILIGAVESVIPVMLRDRGASTVAIGAAITLFALPITLVSTPAGRLADRVGPNRVASIGIGVIGVGAMFYGFLPGVLLPVGVMSLVGVADGFGFTASQVAVSRAVPQHRQAGALGLMGATEVLGAGLSAAPSAYLYEHAGARVTWFVLGLSTLVAVAAAHHRFRRFSGR